MQKHGAKLGFTVRVSVRVMVRPIAAVQLLNTPHRRYQYIAFPIFRTIEAIVSSDLVDDVMQQYRH